MEPNPQDVTYFAETDFRNQKRKFGIKQEDRTRHVYVIGKTGMGKSTMLLNMAIQDVQSDRGLAFLDPHGNLVEELLDYIPAERVDDVLYFAPFDLAHPVSFNVMEDVGYERRHLVSNGLMSAFKKIWVDAWSARMEYILNNTLLALLEYPDSTLLGVNRMLADKTYRKRVVENVSDVAVRAFWQDEFANYSDRYMTEAGAAIQNKIGQFISNPLIRNIVGQSRSSFDVRELMDQKKILLINLSKGKVGEDNANLLGSMLITKIYLAAMSRSDVSPYELKALPQFYFYVDEFQSFANESFADILSEARKYNLSLTIAHQYIEQMTPEVRAAVFGNVGTMMSFRVGATDAEVLEREFAPTFIAADIVNLGFAQIYLRLMIDGVGSKPFSAKTLAPFPQPSQSYSDLIIRRSREQYALSRTDVEQQLVAWHESSAGLIDDPIVKRNREKQSIESQKQIDSYQKSSPDMLQNIEMAVPRPKNSEQKVVKAEGGSDPGLNQRLQKAIYKTQHFPKSHDLTDEKESQKEKKAGKKESLNELRTTLADVLKGAGLQVPNSNPAPKQTKKSNETSNNEATPPSESIVIHNSVSGKAQMEASAKDQSDKIKGSDNSASAKVEKNKVVTKKSQNLETKPLTRPKDDEMLPRIVIKNSGNSGSEVSAETTRSGRNNLSDKDKNKDSKNSNPSKVQKSDTFSSQNFELEEAELRRLLQI